MRKVLVLIILCLIALPSIAVVRVAGSDPYANKDINKEFWAAIEKNDTNKVKKLIQKDKSLVFAKNDKGMTGYLRAVEKHFKAMAWLLGKNFSKENERGPRGNALHMAVEDRDLSMAQVVLSVSQLEGDENMVNLINAPRLGVPKKAASYSKDMDTPLHIAAELCDFAIYEYLVSMGGNPNKINGAFEKPKDILATCPPPEEKKEESKSSTAGTKQTPL